MCNRRIAEHIGTGRRPRLCRQLTVGQDLGNRDSLTRGAEPVCKRAPFFLIFRFIVVFGVDASRITGLFRLNSQVDALNARRRLAAEIEKRHARLEGVAFPAQGGLHTSPYALCKACRVVLCRLPGNCADDRFLCAGERDIEKPTRFLGFTEILMLANRAANLHGAVVARVLDQLLVELVAFASLERVHRRAFRDELRLLRG